jgi:hypothetical protein
MLLQAIAEQFSHRMAHQSERLVNNACSLLLHARDLEDQLHSRLLEPCTRRVFNFRLQRTGNQPLPEISEHTKQV